VENPPIFNRQIINHLAIFHSNVELVEGKCLFDILDMQ